MQVVMNKCFLLNPEKKLVQICLIIFKKNTKTTNFNTLQIQQNDITEPKAKRLDYSNNQLNC